MTDLAITVGSSEIASLFGCGWRSYFELYHQKIGKLPRASLDRNERVFWGTELEHSVARGFARMSGYRIRKVRRKIQHRTVAAMVASPDFEIICHEDGPGVLEIKTADREEWFGWDPPAAPHLLELEEVDGGWSWNPPSREPPLAYQLQLQHQLSCWRRGWGVIAVLVGGNDLRPFRFAAHAGVIAKIEEGVAEFERRVRERDAPEPDYPGDAGAVVALQRWGEVQGQIDLRDDAEARGLADLYTGGMKLESWGREAKEVARAKLLRRMGNSAVAWVNENQSVRRPALHGGGYGFKVHTLRRYRR